MRDFWLGMRDYRPVAAEGSSVGSNSTIRLTRFACRSLALLSNPLCLESEPDPKLKIISRAEALEIIFGWAPGFWMEHLRDSVQDWDRGRFTVSVLFSWFD